MLRLFIVFFLFACVCYSSEYRPTIEEAEKHCIEVAFAEEEQVLNAGKNGKQSVTSDKLQDTEESWAAIRIKRAEAAHNSIKAGRFAYKECMSKYGFTRQKNSD